jgi:transposase
LLTGTATDDYPNLFFDVESDGVRVLPGIRSGSICIEYIENHFIHRVTLESATYFDRISYGAFDLLYKQNNSLRERMAQVEEDNSSIKEEVTRLKQQLFGTSSEQSASIAPELPPPAEQEPTPDIPSTNQPSKERVVQMRGRKPLPAHLPRERITYELPLHERFCPCCNGAIRPIGEEVTEQLTVIPARFKVLQHARKKYVCRDCGKFVTAPGNKSLIEKSSYASADFLAHVACSKYQFGLPFYRQEAIFEQAGLAFNRTTLANLMIGCADKLSALHETLRQELLRQNIIHADETNIQVLKEADRKPQTRSYLWLYRSSQTAPQQIVLFDYQMTRAGEHPRRFLGVDEDHSFKGFLQVDGYAGYNGLHGITRVGCMAHVRRKFTDVIKTLPPQATTSPAHHAEEIIGRLYGIERQTNGLPERIRYKVRQEESIPILQDLKSWLDDMRPKVAPKSGLGKAIGYALDQWTVVTRYVDDGCLAIDNNIAEREIKAVVIGRKNWLFADSMEGMHANAVMYSLVQTAKANGINPFDYLKYVIETMPLLRTAREVESLLPWNMPRANLEMELMAA